MARLNIEEQFWFDVMLIIARYPDQDSAIGNAVRWFRFAQQRHRKGALVSEQEFIENGFSEALIPVFAKRTPSGIQAKGSEKHFAWLNQKILAGKAGGAKSAKRLRKKDGTFEPQIKTIPSELQAQPSTSQPSLLSSLSSNTLNSLNSPKEQKTKGFIAAYCEHFKARYGTNPVIDGKSSGIAKRLSQSMGEEKSLRVLEAFFRMPDADLVKSKHPLAKLEFKLNEVVVFADAGTFTPRAQAAQVDRKQAEELQGMAEYAQREKALESVFTKPKLLAGGEDGKT